MSEQQSSYRQIFKATSIFGGVQIYQIVISIIRSKLVAVLLGAQGMGISGLLVSVTTLISSITSLGMSTSAVRNISEANQKGDEQSIEYVVAVVKKLALLTGMAGSILTLVLAPLLSELTFGNNTYSYAFVALSVTFLLGSLSGAQSVLLQGMRKLSYLAQSNVLAATAGLLISIPIYYVYGQQGIVPAIVVTAAVTTAAAYYYGSKIPMKTSISVSFREAWKEGQGMIRLGIMLSLSTVIAGVAAYTTRLFIGRQGNLVDVGLYNAGFAIVNTYVGMIFTAISTDYYPRLSAAVNDPKTANKLVNQQSEMALLILAPILTLFLVALKYVVLILYTNEFLVIISMVQWFVVAIIFKAVAWAIGFLFIAKGSSKTFFWNELIANAYLFGLSILGYFYFGLQGLGMAFLFSFVLSVVQNFMITKHLYQFKIEREMLNVFIICLILVISCMLVMRYAPESQAWLLAIPIGLASVAYSWWQLNKRIDFSYYINRFISRRQG